AVVARQLLRSRRARREDEVGGGRGRAAEGDLERRLDPPEAPLGGARPSERPTGVGRDQRPHGPALLDVAHLEGGDEERRRGEGGGGGGGGGAARAAKAASDSWTWTTSGRKRRSARSTAGAAQSGKRSFGPRTARGPRPSTSTSCPAARSPAASWSTCSPTPD